jgi:hypothetical protein
VHGRHHPGPQELVNRIKTLIWSFRLPQPNTKKHLEKYADSRNKKTSMEGDIDFLVAAHNGFFFYDSSKGQPGTRLWPDKDGDERDEYVRAEYDNGDMLNPDLDFAETIGFTPTPESQAGLAPSTQLVLHLVQNNESALANIAARVAAWCQNTDLDITQLMLGE